MGVTGARTVTSSVAPALVDRVREHSPLPVGVGLGVSTGAQAAEVASYADGVVVGSALVRCLLDADSDAAGPVAVGELAADLAAGVRAAVSA
jgi:tryptophan synthase alpha chain